MSQPMQLQNRAEIRQSIGYKTGDVIVGTATSTVDTTSLLDTTNLRGGDDEHNEKQVIIYDATGSIVDGEIRTITDFATATSDATTTAFSATITTGDKYEMWRYPIKIAQINDIINQAIVKSGYYKDKVLATTFTERYKSEYNCLSGFIAVDQVEYQKTIDEYYDLHLCETAWDESVDSDVTVSVDENVYLESAKCVKLVVAAGASANDIIATDSITSTDISNCDTVEFWIYSTVALAASDYQLLLDDTASCASAVESLNLAAVTAKTWTRQILTLANPMSDTAIISIGLKMVTDKGAHTIYIDDIKAIRSTSRRFVPLAPEWWGITKGSTPYLRLNSGHPVPDNTLLRITGYQLPTLFSDDTTDADINPAYLIAQTTATLLQMNAIGNNLDVAIKRQIIRDNLTLAQIEARSISTSFRPNTRWV